MFIKVHDRPHLGQVAQKCTTGHIRASRTHNNLEEGVQSYLVEWAAQ